jgi:hypothetical protein
MVLRNIIRSLLVAASAFGLPSAAGVAQTMTRLSEDRTWHPGNATSCASYSTTMPMSGDGRYIAFDSLASNIVAGDTNGWSDVFVQERSTGKLVRMSVSSSGGEGNSWSVDPAISSTGRYVVFRSAASNLVAGDTNGSEDIFLHDRDPDGNGVFDGGNGVTTRLSVDSSGNQTTGSCGAPTISSDGTKVIFVSDATNLVSRDTNGAPDAFLRNVAAGTTTRVSVGSGRAGQLAVSTPTSPEGRSPPSVPIRPISSRRPTRTACDVFVRALVGGHEYDSRELQLERAQAGKAATSAAVCPTTGSRGLLERRDQSRHGRHERRRRRLRPPHRRHDGDREPGSDGTLGDGEAAAPRSTPRAMRHFSSLPRTWCTAAATPRD